MEHKEDLAKLEQYIEKLIESHSELKNLNNEMSAQLQAKEQEIADLQETIKNLQDDRSVMRDRVSGLIDRIDEWEKTIDSETSADSSTVADQGRNLSKESSTLFNVAAEQSSEPA